MPAKVHLILEVLRYFSIKILVAALLTSTILSSQIQTYYISSHHSSGIISTADFHHLILPDPDILHQFPPFLWHHLHCWLPPCYPPRSRHITSVPTIPLASSPLLTSAILSSQIQTYYISSHHSSGIISTADFHHLILPDPDILHQFPPFLWHHLHCWLPPSYPPRSRHITSVPTIPLASSPLLTSTILSSQIQTYYISSHHSSGIISTADFHHLILPDPDILHQFPPFLWHHLHCWLPPSYPPRSRHITSVPTIPLASSPLLFPPFLWHHLHCWLPPSYPPRSRHITSVPTIPLASSPLLTSTILSSQIQTYYISSHHSSGIISTADFRLPPSYPPRSRHITSVPTIPLASSPLLTSTILSSQIQTYYISSHHSSGIISTADFHHLILPDPDILHQFPPFLWHHLHCWLPPSYPPRSRHITSVPTIPLASSPLLTSTILSSQIQTYYISSHHSSGIISTADFHHLILPDPDILHQFPPFLWHHLHCWLPPSYPPRSRHITSVPTIPLASSPPIWLLMKTHQIKAHLSPRYPRNDLPCL